MEIYLVGGRVRDELLGRKTSSERDFVVLHATEEEFFKRFPRAKKVGKKKCVYLVGRDEYVLSQASSIEEDLLDRDLTINAIARDQRGKIYAHPLSLSDLKRKVLRAISKENFEKDPLRVYRAARFAAVFPEFSLDPELLDILQVVGRDKALMEILSRERIASEILKALSAPAPSRFFESLINTRATSYWMEEVNRTCRVNDLSLIDECRGDEMAVWMGLCYCFLRSCGEVRGLDLLSSMIKRIGLPRRFKEGTHVFFRFFQWGVEFPNIPLGDRIEMLMYLDKKSLISPFFRVVEIVEGIGFHDEVKKHLEVIRSVHLPPSYRGLGPACREILLKMRIEALKDAGFAGL